MICPLKCNLMLQGFSIQTKDNKLYEAAISQITYWIELIKLMQCFREDFPDYAFLVGHSYRRIDFDINNHIVNLEKIEPSVVTTYTDPYKTSIVAYHQHANVKKAWSKNSMYVTEDSWFIPFSNNIADIKGSYIVGETVGNAPEVFDLFNNLKVKYGITDTTNLRIGASERILAMHSTKTTNEDYYDRDGDAISDPAPMDPAILPIWLKIQLLSNSPDLINVILSPSLHHKIGTITTAKDAAGNPIILSSIPSPPAPSEQITNPTKYANDAARFANFEKALKDSGDVIRDCFTDGGIVSTPADHEIKPIESGRTLPAEFIKTMVDLLDEFECLCFGVPIALIRASGTELASSRNIVEIFNNANAGYKMDYESKADDLIKMEFAGRTWTVTITEDDKEKTVTYSFEDIKAHFELDTPSTKDLLQEAQVLKTNAETMNLIKTVGGSQADVQALGSEYGFGALVLDNYNQAPAIPDVITPDENQDPTTEPVKASLPLLSAANPTSPSGFKDETLIKLINEAYEEGKAGMDHLFEEH